jgi:hypothetical protein
MRCSPDALIHAEAILRAACVQAAASLVVEQNKILPSQDPQKAVAFIAMQIREHIDKPSDWLAD